MAGKTTSFMMIVELVQPNSGNIYLDDLNNYPMYKRGSRIWHKSFCFRKLSIEDNILSVLLTKLSKEEQVAKMESLIAEFSLHPYKSR
jgi:lipopolysaccharide export system ATP-binding protein